jgi:hypothetical protein
MSLTVEGTIERSMMGIGTWTLVTADQRTYEIMKGAPKELLQAGLKVKAKGLVREDVMTMAMVGPVLEVKSFEAIEP